MKIKYLPTLLVLTFAIVQLTSCVEKSAESEKATVKTETPKVSAVKEINAKDEFENELIKIIRAFANHDQKTLNTYIDPNVGIYLIPGPGTLLHFERLDSIDFTNPYIQYHKFVTEQSASEKISYETLPTFDCENFTWNKYGLFVAKEYGSILTFIIQNPQNAVEGKVYSEAEIKTINNIDKITRSIILAEKDTDVHFGLAKLNGRYIITFLDLHESYCDV